jgi:Flp pilus assembly protein TadD
MSHSRKILLSLAMVLVAGWIYWPAIHGGWIWDDKTEMPQMAALRGPGALWTIWFAPNTGDYYPVKTTLEWLQWQAWGDNTFGYHLTNICLHACSGLLLWHLLKKLGVRYAFLGGLLFVVHPVAVESVAWVDELKNVLSLPFVLLAMLAYIDFDRAGSGKCGRRYFLSLFLFLVAMLCKSSAVMFPFVILLYSWWKRGTPKPRELLSTAPFFAISLALGVVAIWFQKHHGFGGQAAPPLGGVLTRSVRAGLAAAFYFAKGILPVGLMPIYPRWPVDPASLVSYLPWLVFAAVFAWLWTKRATWGRHALFGLGWFFLNLAPILGYIPISHMRFTWTMDHLVYLPLVGLIGLAAAGLGALDSRASRAAASLRGWVPGAAAVICLWLAVQSRAYAAIFQSEDNFWSYAVRSNPSAWLASNNLGNVFLDRGDPQSAIGHYEQALRLNPEYPEAEYNLGLALAGVGRLPEAIVHYQASLRLQPENGDAYNNLGNALRRMGRTQEAIEQYARALRLEPDNAAAHFNLGNALAQAGRIDEAIGQFEQASQEMPDDADMHFDLGIALAQEGRIPEAITQYEQVLRLRPDDADARDYLQRAQAMEKP